MEIGFGVVPELELSVSQLPPLVVEAVALHASPVRLLEMGIRCEPPCPAYNMKLTLEGTEKVMAALETLRIRFPPSAM